MKFVTGRKPSPAMAVAVTALVVAASGTAVAAGLATGDNLIRPRSLSGNRLRNHSVTGLQVAAGTLGKVPKAKKADQAFVAGSSENAVNAQDAQLATNARNASTLGGQPPSSFLPAADRVGTNGLMKVTAGSGPVTLFTFGPFTVTITCTKSGSTTAVAVSASSAEAGSIIDSSGRIPGLGVSSSGSASKSAPGIDFTSQSGVEAIFSAADGVNSMGTDCWANWVGMR
jgi:hypothetical protein